MESCLEADYRLFDIPSVRKLLSVVIFDEVSEKIFILISVELVGAPTETKQAWQYQRVMARWWYEVRAGSIRSERCSVVRCK